MKYNELKQRYKELVTNRTNSLSIIEAQNSNIVSKQQRLISLDTEKKSKLKIEEEKERIRFEESIVEPFEAKIKKQEDLKRRAKRKLDDKLSSITEDKYRSKYSEDVDIDKDLESCKAIKDVTEGFYGKDFVSVIEKSMSSYSYNNVEPTKIVNELRAVSDILTKNYSTQEYIDSCIESIKYDSEKKEQVLGASLVALFIIFMMFYAYPIALIAIISTIVYNLYKSSLFIRCTSSRVSLESNVTVIEEELSNIVKRAMNRDAEKYTKEYRKYCEKVDERITALSDASLLELELQRPNFLFNPTNIEEDFRVLRTSVEDAIEASRQIKKETEEKLKTIEADIESVKLEMSRCMRNIEVEYLPNEIIPNLELPSDILIDMTDDGPITFDLPKESTLFVYRKDDVCRNFIELIFYQIALRTNPAILKFKLIDTTYLGDILKKFSTDDLVDIAEDDKSYEEVIKSANEEMRKRLSLTTEYDGVFGYNEFMRSMDCPQLGYNFILNYNPSMDSLTTKESIQLLRNGHKAGFFNYIFMEEKVLLESDLSKYTELSDTLGKIYSIQKGKVSKKAKLYYKTLIESRK